MAFRFILKLLGANPGAGFTAFIYNLIKKAAPIYFMHGTYLME